MKRVAVGALGGLLTLAGIALLVLPGPGFVLVAAGLAVLATEFEWAKRPLDLARRRAGQGLDEMRRSRLRALGALVAALILVGIGVADLTGLDVPFVNVLSAILLVASGLFLIGTVAHARRTRGALTRR